MGDTGRVSFTFLEANSKTVRDLTGYAAWVSWQYDGAAAPHVIRAGVVSGTNGLVTYERQGDELTQVGKLLAQCTVMPMDWYIGTAATGRGYHRYSSEIISFNVKARPS